MTDLENYPAADILPSRGLVLIRVYHQRQTAGGIEIPDNAKLYGRNVGQIMAVGKPGRVRNPETGEWELFDHEFQVGDWVLIRFHAEQSEIRCGEDRYTILDPSNLLAKLPKWDAGVVAA